MGSIVGVKNKSPNTYERSPASGGPFTNVPLKRLRWIDGNTTVPLSQQNGSESLPYQSPQAWLSSLGPPTSTDDANTLEMGVIAPTPPNVWSPNPQTWIIPPSRNIQIGQLAQSDGPNPNDFSPLTVTWTNTPIEGVTGSSLVLSNLNISGLAMTVTDVDGAPPSSMALIGSTENGNYTGTLDISGATGFGNLTVANASADLTVIPPASPTFQVLINDNSFWESSNLSCGSFYTYDSGIVDLGTLTSATTASFFTSSINAKGITAAKQLTFDQNCSFESAIVIAAPLAIFDGPSWASFLEQGGNYGTTVVLVIGGFLAGPVPGPNIATPPLNAITVSLNGGNWYTVTALAGAATTTVSIADTPAKPGDTIAFTRTDTTEGAVLVIADLNTSNVVGTISGPGSLVARFNGTAWVPVLL
jgi:hypothetical protein